MATRDSLTRFFSKSGKDSGEEEHLLSETIIDESETSKRTDLAITAVNNLHEFLKVVYFSTTVASLQLVVNSFTAWKTFPNWSVLVVVLLGHAAAFLIFGQIINNICRSIFYRTADNQLIWHSSYEKTVALIQFVVYRLMIFVSIFLCVLLFEIFSYLEMESQLSESSLYVPFYIISILGLLNAVTLRTNNWSVAMSWTALLVFCIFWNLKHQDIVNFSWVSVFYPIYLLMALWTTILLYILINKESGRYVLKTPQSRALWLYLISLNCSVIFLIYIVPFLTCITENPDNTDDCYDSYSIELQICTIMTSLALMFFFIGAIYCTDMSLAATIARMGAERPKNLIRNEAGGWDVDNSFDSFILFGEIEVRDTFNELPFC